MPSQQRVRPADDIAPADIIKGWDEAAEEFTGFFAGGEEFYHRYLINPAILELLGDLRDKKVLDLACGEGHLARRLAERTQGQIQLLGVDASEKMISIAQAKSQELSHCLTFQQVDACHLDPLPADFFDVTVCNMALMDIQDYGQAIREVARTMKPKGLFVFSILTGWRVDDYFSSLAWEWTIKTQMIHQTYSFHRPLSDYVSALRQAGFVIVDLREPRPSPELVQMKPRLVHNLKRGDFLVVKCGLWEKRAG